MFLSKNKKKITIFCLKITIFTAVKNQSILYMRVIVMLRRHFCQFSTEIFVVCSHENCQNDLIKVCNVSVCKFHNYVPAIYNQTFFSVPGLVSPVDSVSCLAFWGVDRFDSCVRPIYYVSVAGEKSSTED